jgi:hypothetical protein
MLRDGCGRRDGAWQRTAPYGVVVLVLLAFGGCGQSQEKGSGRKVTDSRGESSPVVGEWRPAPSNKPADKQVGEDCSAHGASECVGALCVHAKAERGSGYVCSRRCQADAECPATWRCVSVVPGAQEAVCLPPATPTAGPSAQGQ